MGCCEQWFSAPPSNCGARRNHGLPRSKLAFLRFAQCLDGGPAKLTQAVADAFNDAAGRAHRNMTDKELISKSRFITPGEIDDIRFLVASGQITPSGAIRTIGQPPDYRYTAAISTHETPDFLLALLAEIAQTDMGAVRGGPDLRRRRSRTRGL